MLVVFLALCTAFRPLTPCAPPALVLIESHPGPSGWQGTCGIATVLAGVAVWPERCSLSRGAKGNGMARARSWAPEVPCGLAEPVGEVEEVVTGPVRSWQPEAPQPLAAEPTNVGVYVPRLDDVTAACALVAPRPALAAINAPMARTRARRSARSTGRSIPVLRAVPTTTTSYQPRPSSVKPSLGTLMHASRLVRRTSVHFVSQRTAI